MKVTSVKLQSFGALNGRFNLDPGLTIVGGPNESGKSTLHTALRVALCGVDLPARGRMPKDTEEVLRRFRPWVGKQFMVEAEVELNGSRYRFVRDLDQPDNCQVFDLDRGGEVTDKFRRGRAIDVSVGLGMSRDAFLAVSTVAQDQILNLTGASLQEDLQRATSTSGSDRTARSAIDLLQRWRQDKIRGDRTTTKPLDPKQTPKALDEAEFKLARARELRQQLALDLAEQDGLQAELSQIEATTSAAESAWKTAELAGLEQDLAAVAEIDKALAATPEPKLPKDPALLRDAATGARGLVQQLQEAEAKVQQLAPQHGELERLSAQSAPSELAFLIGALEQTLPPLPPRSDIPGRADLLDRRRVAFYRWTSDLVALVGGIAGVLLVAMGLGLSPIRGLPSGIAMVVAGLVVLVLAATGFLALQSRLRLLLAVGGFTSVAQMRRAVTAEDPEMARARTAREKVEAGRAQANRRLAELGIPEIEVDKLKTLAEELPAAQVVVQERASWTTTANRFRDELISRAKRVGISGTDPVALAAELGRRLHELDDGEDSKRRRVELLGRRTERLGGREVKAMKKRSGELRSELGESAEPPVVEAGVQSDQLRMAYDVARAKRDQIRERLLPLQGRLTEQLRETGDLAGLEEHAAELRSELAQLTSAEAAVKLAISELELAEGSVHKDLAPVLAEGLRQWLPKVTGQRYQQAWVNPSDLAMHVSARDTGAQIRVDDLSQGTREQIYVCLRMVLAKALSPDGEAVPLFFDDPCVGADDARSVALLETLLELSKTSQVVVFSHESRVGGWAQRNEVPILAMKLVPASAELADAASVEPAAGI
jgi:hypothetical protein